MLLVLMFHTQAFSQNIPNPSFESWDTISQPGWYMIPTGWSKISGSTSKRSIEDGYFDDVYDGNSSLMLANSGIKTRPPSAATTTFSYNKRPHHFSFWSKTLSYDSKPFTVEVVLFKESGTIISKSTFTSGARYYTINEDLVNKFQETFLVLDYLKAENPDSARITFTSTLDKETQPISLLFLDSLSFSSYSVGVEEYASESLNQYWTITPNPVSSNLMYIDYSDARIVDNATIQITDIFGKLLFESSTGELINTDGRMIINTSDLGSGTYSVTIVSEHHRETKKIVVIH